jgi:alpha-ketoglutarate-dependent taurine dioxygenase
MHSSIQTLYLSYDERESIYQKMATLSAVDSEEELLDLRKEYKKIIEVCINPSTLQRIKEFPKQDMFSALIVRGFPTDLSMPSSPYNGRLELKQLKVVTGLNFGLYEHLNITPVTYLGENAGKLIRHVVPTHQNMGQKSSQGSATLGMHVDNCHLPLTPEVKSFNSDLSPCPEYLSLFGLRCDVNVSTRLSLLDEALERVSKEAREQLQQPDYILSTPDSFSGNRAFDLPILVKDVNGIFYSRFDKEYTTPKTKLAQKAFDELSAALLSPDVINHLILQPGDFLIFKNQRVTHGREKFTPRLDGTDRWLFRLFGLNDLQHTKPVDINTPYHVLA